MCALRRFTCVLLPALAVASCTVSANVGEIGASPVDAGDGSDTPPSRADAASSPPDASPPDAATDATDSGPPIIDGGCGVVLPMAAGFVSAQVVLGPSPQLRGGTLVEGDYALTSYRVFVLAQGTVEVREVLRVRGSPTSGAFERLVERRAPVGDFDAVALHGESSTYSIGQGTPSIFEDPVCPASASMMNGTFEVRSDVLVLFDPIEGIERTYQRIR